MIRTISSAIFSLFMATPLYADIKLDIRNCTGEDIDIRAYNAKDSSLGVPYSEKKDVKPGKKVTLKCKGEGKGFCKVRVYGITCGGSFSDIAFHKVRKKTLSVVDATGEWKTKKKDGLKGTFPIIELHKYVEDPSSTCSGFDEISCP